MCACHVLFGKIDNDSWPPRNKRLWPEHVSLAVVTNKWLCSRKAEVFTTNRYLFSNKDHLFANKRLVRRKDSVRGKSTWSGIAQLFGTKRLGRKDRLVRFIQSLIYFTSSVRWTNLSLIAIKNVKSTRRRLLGMHWTLFFYFARACRHSYKSSTIMIRGNSLQDIRSKTDDLPTFPYSRRRSSTWPPIKQDGVVPPSFTNAPGFILRSWSKFLPLTRSFFFLQ